jgi:hypothetical protein
MNFSFKYDVGDYVVYNNQILSIISFGYFWEGVCELSNGKCCRLRYLTPIHKIKNFSEEEIRLIVRNTINHYIIDTLVPSPQL